MRWETEKCPQCGQDAHATLETLQGKALLQRGDGDELEYEGTTEIFWDTQETVRNEVEEDCLMCANGHEWYSRQTIYTDRGKVCLP